jgi:hypothetical protein
MRDFLMFPTIAVAALVTFPSVAKAQQVFQRPGEPEQRPPSLYQKIGETGPGGPAPRRDLSGSWAGPLEPQAGDVAPMTALGQSLFKLNVPEPFSPHSNDPWATCDPFGFPRSATNETRGIAFAQMPDRVVIMTQYQKIWREVWMDGRKLPQNVGHKGGPDSRWYGFSVGHWDGDNTLVVETTGVDDSTWIDRRGYPHSVDMHVEERYTRVDHNHLVLAVTIDDPKIYTKPFVIATNKFKWIPDQEGEEQLCVPSQALIYLNTVAAPASQTQPTGKK